MIWKINYPRLTGAVLAVGLATTIGFVIDASLLSILIASYLLPLLIFVGALTPQVLTVLRSARERRVDFYQWKFGVTFWSAALAILLIPHESSNTTESLAVSALLSLYIAGKWGCYRSSCCGAVPYRVVNATASLPATEVWVSCALLILVCVCIVFDRKGSAVLIGLTGHLTTRALSYWARGEQLSLRNWTGMPDIPALFTIIVFYVLNQSIHS